MSASPESAVVHVEAAAALAETIVCAIYNCAEEGRPFTQLQQITLVSTGLLAFDGIGERIERLSEMAETLRAIERLDET